MKNNYKYRLLVTYFVIFIIFSIISACQSSIRFTTKGTNEKFVQKHTEKEFITEKRVPDYNKRVDIENPLISYALSKVGTPYCYGGDSDNCFDCSGFVVNVFKNVGIFLPRTAQEQYYYTKRIQESELQIGDLVFFASKSKISHVGIYIGNNEIVHSSTSMGVIKQSLNDYHLRSKLVGFGRILN